MQEKALHEQEVRHIFQTAAVPRGYREVTLPILETYETYSALLTSQEKKRMVKVIAPDGGILVMRPDVTIPLMKERSLLRRPEPVSRYWYMQSVFRLNAAGDFPEETRQAGIELVGQQSAAHDAEVILLACELLTRAGIKDFKMEIGHAGILKESGAEFGLSACQVGRIAELVRQKNAGGLQKLISLEKLDEQSARFFKQLLLSYGAAQEVLRGMEHITLSSRMSAIFRHVEEVLERVTEGGYGARMTLDPAMVNEMSYYSGIQFQGFSRHYGMPVLMGGRYDELGCSGDASEPAVGFACKMDVLQAAACAAQQTQLRRS